MSHRGSGSGCWAYRVDSLLIKIKSCQKRKKKKTRSASAFAKAVTLAVRFSISSLVLTVPTVPALLNTHTLNWANMSHSSTVTPLFSPAITQYLPSCCCYDFAAALCFFFFFYISSSSGDVCLHTEQTNTMTVHATEAFKCVSQREMRASSAAKVKVPFIFFPPS